MTTSSLFSREAGRLTKSSRGLCNTRRSTSRAADREALADPRVASRSCGIRIILRLHYFSANSRTRPSHFKCSSKHVLKHSRELPNEHVRITAPKTKFLHPWAARHQVRETPQPAHLSLDSVAIVRLDGPIHFHR